MENISQQTDEISSDTSTPCLCVKIWPYICPIVVAAVFVGLALTFAIIYTGYGITRSHDADFHFYHSNDTAIYCIRRRNDLQLLRDSNLKLAETEDYPYVGSLVSIHPSVLLCTVVVVNKRFVLTGANCFSPNFVNLRVKVGSNFWDGGNEYKVESFVINDEYNGRALYNNLALIRVNKDIVMSNAVQAAKILKTKFKKSETGIMLGWNFWATAEHDHIKLVQQELMIWTQSRCEKYMGSYGNHKLICASLNNSLCNLDITGPLIVNGNLAGFWSWGLSCIQVPSIFTDLFYFRRWIFKRSDIQRYN
ncbi:hypothetical protein ILUMI_10379 [Ignelater luminosus]|uniref:Peptidase S1 domain-containing protein n=1 Tax=Ignelater luminosus TaxID=2038154 RepID=A0A8K0CY88_IGNLU|nr:hypothetical protein ILUMI_10379 [Ignelater luminosus]